MLQVGLKRDTEGGDLTPLNAGKPPADPIRKEKDDSRHEGREEAVSLFVIFVVEKICIWAKPSKGGDAKPRV
jgi:hypothetical protein